MRKYFYKDSQYQNLVQIRPVISAIELATRWTVRLDSGFIVCTWHIVLFYENNL